MSALALVVFTFFDWYGYEQGGNLLARVDLFGLPADAWQSLDVIPWLLVLTALVALATAVQRLAGWRWDPVVPPSAAVALLGGLSTLLVLFRILSPPDLVEASAGPGIPLAETVELGAYLALAAALGIAYGGYRAMGERGTSFAKIADGLSKPRPGARPKPRPGRAKRSPAPPSSRRRSRSSSG